jgi:hypothetical protein
MHSFQVSPKQEPGLLFPIFETSGLFFPIFENYPKVHIIFHQIWVAPTGLGMQKTRTQYRKTVLKEEKNG